jgi:hypothetical protein
MIIGDKAMVGDSGALGQVAVDVYADLSKLASDFKKGEAMASSFDKKMSSKASAAAAKNEAAMRDLDRATERLAKSYSPLHSAQIRYVKDLADIDRLQKANIFSAKDAAMFQDKAAQAYARSSGELQKVSGTTAGLASKAGLYVTVASAALGALAIAVSEVTQAFIVHEGSIDAFNANLKLTGNLSAATSDQIKQMATAISEGTLQTEKSVLQAAASLAKVPGITEAALQSALEASSRLADALGKDVTDTAKTTGEVLTALANRDMKALFNAMEGLNPSLQLTIANLAQAGKTADAQKALIAGLANAAGDGPNGLTTATDKAGKSWDRFKQTLGGLLAGPITTGLDAITTRLDLMRQSSISAGFELAKLFSLSPVGLVAGLGQKILGYDKAPAPKPAKKTATGRSNAQQAQSLADKKALEAMKKSYEDKPKGSRARVSAEPEFTSEDATAALRAGGLKTTSARRSYKEQKKIYEEFLAGKRPGPVAKPGTSPHEKGMAVDVGKKTNPGASAAKIEAALEAAGAKNVRVLDEGHAYHVTWAKGRKDLLETERDAAALAKKQSQMDERYRNMLSGLQDEELQSRLSEASNSEEIAAIRKEQVNRERDKYNAGLDSSVDQGELTKANAATLKAANEQRRITELRQVDAEKLQAMSADELEISSSKMDNERDLLEYAADSAKTMKARRKAELDLLDLQHRMEAAQLDGVIASAETSNTEKQIAAERKAHLAVLKKLQISTIESQTQGPLAEYLSSLPDSLDKINEAIERIRVDKLEEARNRSVAMADDIGEAFANTARSIINLENPLDILRNLLTDLASTFTEEVLIRPIKDFALQNIGNPLAEQATGAPAGPEGLWAKTLETSSVNASFKIDAMAQAATRAAQALMMAGTDGALPLQLGAANAGTELSNTIPDISNFGNSLSQVLSGLGGGGGGGIASFLGLAASVAGSAFGGGTAIDGGSLGKSLPGVEKFIASMPGKAGGGSTPRRTPFMVGELGAEAVWDDAGHFISTARQTNDLASRMEALSRGIPGNARPGIKGGSMSANRARTSNFRFGDIVLPGLTDERAARRIGKQVMAGIRGDMARSASHGFRSPQ